MEAGLLGYACEVLPMERGSRVCGRRRIRSGVRSEEKKRRRRWAGKSKRKSKENSCVQCRGDALSVWRTASGRTCTAEEWGRRGEVGKLVQSTEWAVIRSVLSSPETK